MEEMVKTIIVFTLTNRSPPTYVLYEVMWIRLQATAV